MKTTLSFLPSIFFALIISAIATTSIANADTGHASSENPASGAPGTITKVNRTIHIAMADDMRFTPANVTVKQGETVKFVVANNGKLQHEMVIGSTAELSKHAEMMRQMPEMKHHESNQITVEPGKTADLIWTFGKTTKVDFACLEPGHFEAGMKGKVNVVVSE
ncbi:cupredoxin family protein [Glaciimonas sp. Gout2]|uniref:cupredoxin domain-containing protein n=1 Tax=unclassified Glaciimonas TaxID=2644401 RepID=UPI002B23C84A|nr:MULTISPECIES: cupredoxin family protein [unclassified Glaciimonas]MEB0011063.1 cupredoxin family protein [Glaciimonas sp. Cout2]MEB0081260.1 cupredoxin family protein [Glaciimonas sp. Gout2]